MQLCHQSMISVLATVEKNLNSVAMILLKIKRRCRISNVPEIVATWPLHSCSFGKNWQKKG